jgi:hypothetical protein
VECELCVNWLTVATVQKPRHWNSVVDVGWEVTCFVFQDLVNWAEMRSTAINMHVESVLWETDPNSSNWRYFLFDFHICLICVHLTVFSYCVTLSQQMVTSKSVEPNNHYVLNVCVSFKCWKIALCVGGCYCAIVTAALLSWWQMLLHTVWLSLSHITNISMQSVKLQFCCLTVRASSSGALHVQTIPLLFITNWTV